MEHKCLIGQYPKTVAARLHQNKHSKVKDGRRNHPGREQLPELQIFNP